MAEYGEEGYVKTFAFRPMTEAEARAIAKAATLNRANAKASDRQLTLAAENAPIRLIYGEVRVGAQLLNVLAYGTNIVLQCLWGYACEGVQSVTLNDQALPTGSTATHYDGSQTSADATMVAAFAAQTPAVTYADTLEGFAYSVLVVPASKLTGGLNVNAVIRGREVYDPRHNLIYPSEYNAASWTDPLAKGTFTTGIDDPFGGTAAVRYANASGLASICRLQHAGAPSMSTMENGKTYTLSFWCRRKVAGASPPLCDVADGIPSGDYSSQLVTDQWVRVTMTATMVANRSVWAVDLVNNNASTHTYDFYGIQINEGSFASTYVQTTTATVTSTSYDTNPSLILADFLSDSTYGAGMTVDWETVDSCANANDATTIGEVHRRLDGWSLEQVTGVDSVIETLRTYAGVFLSRRGATVYLTPDQARASDATYSHTSGQVAEFSDFVKRDMGNAPTVVEIAYTDTSTTPWRERTASASLAGVGSSLPRRVSAVRLNGIQRYSQAYREAVRRLNELNGSDLSGSVTVFDAGIAHEVGDVVTLTLPIGITSKDFRVTSVESAGSGLWALTVTEYDADAYSTEIRTASSYPDTDLPNPASPPAPTVAAAEELFVTETGITTTRGRLTITSASFIWTRHYEVEVWTGDTLIDSGVTQTGSYATPPLQEGVAYTCRARVVSTLGVAGDWGSDSFTAVGKALPPGDVSAVTGFEVGGDVYLAWDAAVDVDVWRYEIRWGTTSATWDTATLLDRVDGLRYISKGVVTPGVRRFFVKAVDSVKQYSTNAATVDVTVTIDPDALQLEYYPDNPTKSGMQTYTERDGTIFDITSVGTNTFTAQFGSALSGYTQPIASYWGGTSSWEGDADDPWGATIAATWDVDSTHTDVGTGTSTLYLRLGTNGTAFTDYSGTGLPAKVSARYARAKITSSNCFKVVRGGQRVFGNAQTRTEYGSVSVPSTGTTVTLTNAYFARRNILLTPVENGTSSLYAVADNITLDPGTGANTFDVYLFGTSGLTTGAVDYRFEGI